ncbi:MAG: hypothetical protein ACKPJJ_07995, partial [Planctomycetaceae bacterium]
MLDRWERARKGDALEGESHRLDVFVEPRISVCLQKQETDNGRSEEEWETLPAGVQTLLDQHFVP